MCLVPQEGFLDRFRHRGIVLRRIAPESLNLRLWSRRSLDSLRGSSLGGTELAVETDGSDVEPELLVGASKV